MGPARRRDFLGDRINKARVVIALGTWGLHTPGLGLGLWCEVAEREGMLCAFLSGGNRDAWLIVKFPVPFR